MAALIQRALIKVLIGGGTAAVLGVGANCRLFGRDKMAKQDVDYQDSPKGLLRRVCGNLVIPRLRAMTPSVQSRMRAKPARPPH